MSAEDMASVISVTVFPSSHFLPAHRNRGIQQTTNRKEHSMTDIPEARIVLITCHRCGQLARGPHGTHTCMACIEYFRESARCPDCHSTVTVALLAEDEQHDAEVWADVAHDDTCPNFRARCNDSLR
jgi:hypothetical protein